MSAVSSSMEAEMRAVLTEVVRGPGDHDGLFRIIRDRFDELGGVEVEIPARSVTPRAPEIC
jgi:antitoxin FitA